MHSPILLLASSLLPSPNFKDRLAAPPLPIKPAVALITTTKGNNTFVAALPRVPTPLPINI